MFALFSRILSCMGEPAPAPARVAWLERDRAVEEEECLEVDDYGYVTTKGEAVRSASSSPVSTMSDPSTPKADDRFLPADALMLLTDVYAHMCTRGFWLNHFPSSKFDNRHRAVICGRLANNAFCDAGNVVAASFSLFCAHWGCTEPRDRRLLGGSKARDHELALQTRMRLAACLALSYKFSRGCSSRMAPQFVGDAPAPLRVHAEAPYSHELAYVGLQFFYSGERSLFGLFGPNNEHRSRGLFRELVALEVEMCQGSHVFSSMTKNVVCLAEDRLERLYQKRLLGQWELLEARELLPIFYRALLEPQSVHDSYSWDGAARSGLVLASLALRVWCPTDAGALPGPLAAMLEAFTAPEVVAAERLLAVVADAEPAAALCLLRDLATKAQVRSALTWLKNAKRTSV